MTRWRIQQIFWMATALLLLTGFYLSFLYAPRERVMGDVQRIFYFHMPLAWNGFLAFAITFVFGLLYLRTRKLKYDLWAAASAEVGLLFITLALLTGSIWARSAWGTYWTWEPRLTTAAVLWLMYAFYLILRGYIENREKMRLIAAAYGIVAFINVPIVFMSIRWWRTLHPVLIEPTGLKMETPMALTLIVSLVAFTMFYLLLLAQRIKLAQAEESIRAMKEQLKEV